MDNQQLFWLPVSEALMIGALVGAQREHAKQSPHLGIREFVLCAAVGAACALQQSPALSAVALAALVLIIISFRFRTEEGSEPGFTTDLSLLAVFCLAHVCVLASSEHARAAVIGVSIVITFLLESKDKVRKFFGETLTTGEFTGTLLFLALVFIIYPILPEGNFGPYDGFCPRDIWTFVILVSSVSFGGYFLEKYLGSTSGLRFTAVLGGIASTTATTLSLAKEAKGQPERLNIYWQAATLANAIQFPRLFAFLSAISPPISRDAAVPLLAAGSAGIIMALLIPAKEIEVTETDFENAAKDNAQEDSLELKVKLQDQGESSEESMPPIKMSNPLTLGPALKCGLVLAVVVFINKVAVATMGVNSLIATSILGGLVDVDAIAVSSADLFRYGQIVPDRAVGSVLLAVCMNAVFKTCIAYSTGTPAFAAKMAISFSVMLAVATLALHFF